MGQKLQFKSQFALTEEVVNKNFHKARLKVLHDGLNNNGSIVPLEAIENAKDSLRNTPILAFIVRDEFGNSTGELGGHEIEMKIESKDGQLYLREHYLEQPIGVIPESSEMKIEEMDGRNYLTCDAYIWKSYSNEAYDILIEKGISNASCEMQCKKLEFDDDDVMHITDFEFLGVTCIGVDPGMEGANINMNFSVKDKEKYSNAVKELNEYLKMQLNKPNGKEEFELENEDNKIVNPNVEPNKDENIEPKENFESDENKKEVEGEEVEDIKAEFGLSIDNIRQMVQSQIKDMTVTSYDPYWNETYEVRAYYMRTILPEDKVVVFEDGTDYNKNYGVKYSLNGDALTLDFDNRVEYIQEWREKKAEEQVVSFEKEDKLKDIVLEKFSNKDEEIKTLNTELEELREFKANYEKQVKQDELNSKVEEVVAQFSFGEDEISELKAKALNEEIDVETFEDKLFALEGRKALAKKTKFSKNEEENATKIEVKNVEIESEKIDERIVAIKELKAKFGSKK